MATTSLVLVCALGLLIAREVVKVIHNAFVSPLSRMPGPWYAPITGFPAQLASVRARQIHYQHGLHKKYGKFVRIAPRQVIVADPVAFKEVHRIGGPFVKSDFYKYLNITEPGQGPLGLFQMIDVAEHAKRRKLLGPGLTKTALQTNWEDVVCEKVRYTVQRMKQEAHVAGGEVDVLKWWMLMAGDVISHLAFGSSFDTLKSGEKGPRFDLLIESTKANAIAWHFPLVYVIGRRLPFEPFRSLFTASAKLMDTLRDTIDTRERTSDSRNLFTKILDGADKEETSMTAEDIRVETGSAMIAGTDTTAATLAYLVWAVLSRPTLQKALEDETAKLEEPLMDASLETVPLLNAVIEETLRLYGAAPGALPRVVQAEGVTLGGYEIPVGTTVSTQAWTMHRDPALFQDPETFDYTRWLPPAVDDLSPEAKLGYCPFGAGARTCIGKHLALMELRLAVAMFFRECKGATLSPSTTESSMEVENVFLIAPKGGACKVMLVDE